MTIEADTVVDGLRPELTLECSGNGKLGIQIRVRRAPATPPPLAGVYASFQFNSGASERHEMGWMPEDMWRFRSDSQGEDRFARRFLQSKQVTMSPPVGYSAETPITWFRSTAAPNDAEIARWCR